MLVRIAVSSLLARKFTVLLTIVSICVSFFVLLGINHLKSEMRQSFGRTVSGVDLIVGGRTSSINLLLYSVFRIGNATNSISWASYQHLTAAKGIAWSIPISLGDSHKGYRVMGTSNDYFQHYKYGNKQPLTFRSGHQFEHLYDVVVGAGVAKSLNYEQGTEIVIAHGLGNVSFKKHKGHGFRVTGILEPTGTPIDQTIHVTLPAIETMHGGVVNHVHSYNENGRDHKENHDSDAHELEHAAPNSHDAGDEHALDNPKLSDISVETKKITAFMLGLNSKIATLGQLRAINEYKPEPMLAIMPGLALNELWQMMKMVEQALSIIAFLVLIAALFGLTTMLLASMRERQREIAILRAAGARAMFVILLIEAEAVLIVLAGVILGYLSLVATMMLSQGMLAEEYGLFISSFPQWEATLKYGLMVVGLGGLLALVPAIISYRQSMINGLTVSH